LKRNGGTLPITCCHGTLSVPLGGEELKDTRKWLFIQIFSEATIRVRSTTTTTPKFETLVYCKIEYLSFALDISGSMGGATTAIWKPVAVRLVDEMARRFVNIDRHYLFTYVDTIQSAITTQNPQDFKDTINNCSSFTGSRELTFAALKHAMEQVNTNAFVCVWTDEIGDDTNDASLEAEILNLKASTNSEIFFMVVTRPLNARKARDVGISNDDEDLPSKN
jgi:hypothetical protein